MSERLRISPQMRSRVLEVDAEMLDQAVLENFIKPAVKAWQDTMRSLAYEASYIMHDMLPTGKRGGFHLKDSVVVRKMSDDPYGEIAYWIGPTKTVMKHGHMIPLGLLLEHGTAGGTIIRPTKKGAMRTPYGPKGKVIRGLTKGLKYSERTIRELGRVAFIEERFWHYFYKQPETAAYTEGGGTDVEA